MRTKSELKIGWLAAMLGVALAGTVAQGDASGTWAIDGGGNWDDVNNWVDGNVADGAGGAATFSPASGLSVDATVTQETSRVINAMTFRDNNAFNNKWRITPTGAQTLTLDGNSPTINLLIDTILDMPLVIGNNGTGNALISITYPYPGVNPAITFNSTVTLNRSLDIKGNWGSLTVEGNITGTGDVTVGPQYASVPITFKGTANNFSGNLTIDDTTLYLQSIRPGTVLTITSSGILRPRPNAALVFSGIAGNGHIYTPGGNNCNLTLQVASGIQMIDATLGWSGLTFYKTGAGTAQLNQGWDPRDGGAHVQEGTLVLNHAAALVNDGAVVSDGATLALGAGISRAATPAITFNAGSGLGGSGTYSRGAAWTVPENFRLSPGLSTGTGTLTVDTVGDALTLASGGRLEIDFDAAGTADMLLVVGTLDLSAGGDTLVLRGTLKGGPYTVASANGLVGTFDNVDVTGLAGAVKVRYPGDGTVVVERVAGGTVMTIR